MSVLYLIGCRLCVPNIVSVGVCFEKLLHAPNQSWRVLLDTTSKFALFSVSCLKVEKLMKKANLHEN